MQLDYRLGFPTPPVANSRSTAIAERAAIRWPAHRRRVRRTIGAIGTEDTRRAAILKYNRDERCCNNTLTRLVARRGADRPLRIRVLADAPPWPSRVPCFSFEVVVIAVSNTLN